MTDGTPHVTLPVPPEAAAPRARFVRSLVQSKRDRFDLTYGLRVGVFVVVPLFLGLASGYVAAGVLVTLGTLYLFMVQAPRPDRTPTRVLLLAVATNALAWMAGTMVGTTAGPLQWALVSVGVFAILLGKRYVGADQLALMAAVMFVVAVGLPGGWGDVVPHGLLIALGGAWALLGAALPNYLRWVERPLRTTEPSPGEAVRSPEETLTYSASVGLTVAAGLAIAGVLALPRDYWVGLTVLVALRPDLAATIRFSTMRVLGTVGGAALALGIVFYVGNFWILGIIVVASAAAAFATRAVNYTLYAVCLTVFLIVLLHLSYAGGPRIAVDRVVDTVLGGGLALITGVILVLRGRLPKHLRGSVLSHTPLHPI